MPEPKPPTLDEIKARRAATPGRPTARFATIELYEAWAALWTNAPDDIDFLLARVDRLEVVLRSLEEAASDARRLLVSLLSGGGNSSYIGEVILRLNDALAALEDK